MEERTLIARLPSQVGSEVVIHGFVDSVRDQKNVQFVIVRDHTGKAQIVHGKEDKESSMTQEISALTPESAVTVRGSVIKASQVTLGGVEIHAKSLFVQGMAETPLPIADDSVLEKQMDWRHVSLRHPKNALTFRVQTTMEHAMRAYWAQNGFIELHSPKLMGTASESGAELFELSYFNDKTAYLAQSPQFYKQMAMAAGFDKVFEIGPVFRANPSFTSRHDTEFTSVDVELSWIESYKDVMAMEEEWIVFFLQAVKQAHGDTIKDVCASEVVIPQRPFPRLTLAQARDVLEKKGHVIGHKADLDPQGERLLSDYIRDTHGHEFVFVTDYPTSVRPFYHMRDPNNPDVTLSYDLLWKGIEITTGAQREHRLDILTRQAIEKGVAIEPLTSYLNFFRYGCPPHGGFGLGLTRLLMVMLNASNVREVTYLYRGPHRLSP
ncbi:MAG: aspartate--tRNA(Asn) ligase [Alphaproteobacteria bacterium GM7ARS4]|nr:aspartate--tRNA(Asn) ligase [Alphaproteobacteria bacterium GM7ARS4]